MRTSTESINSPTSNSPKNSSESYDSPENSNLVEQLHNYIYSCNHQEELKSKKLSLLKNFIKDLDPEEYTAYLILILLTLFVALWLALCASPVIGIIFISSILVAWTLKSAGLWLLQRINCKRAEKERLKQENSLECLSNRKEEEVLPLVKLLFSNPKMGVLGETYIKYLHYQRGEILKSALELVHYRLNGGFDSELDLLSEEEKVAIIDDLKREIYKIYNLKEENKFCFTIDYDLSRFFKYSSPHKDDLVQEIKNSLNPS